MQDKSSTACGEGNAFRSIKGLFNDIKCHLAVLGPFEWFVFLVQCNYLLDPHAQVLDKVVIVITYVKYPPTSQIFLGIGQQTILVTMSEYGSTLIRESMSQKGYFLCKEYRFTVF